MVVRISLRRVRATVRWGGGPSDTPHWRVVFNGNSFVTHEVCARLRVVLVYHLFLQTPPAPLKLGPYDGVES